MSNLVMGESPAGTHVSLKTDTLGRLLVQASPPAGAPAQATEATAQAILAQLQNAIDFEETVWRNKTTGAYYTRRMTLRQQTGAFTTVWLDANGTAIPAPNVNSIEIMLDGVDYETDSTEYRALVTTGDYAIGDRIKHFVVFNAKNGAVISSTWLSLNTGSAISAPPAIDIGNDNTAQLQLDEAIKTNSALAHIGKKTDAKITNANDDGTVIALLKGALSFLKNLAPKTQAAGIAVFSGSVFIAPANLHSVTFAIAANAVLQIDGIALASDIQSVSFSATGNNTLSLPLVSETNGRLITATFTYFI